MIDHAEKVLTTQSWGFPNAPEIPSTMPVFKDKPVEVADVAGKETVREVDPEAKTIAYLVDSDAERNADFYSVLPPSNFYFYPFKRLSVKQVTGRQQAKFNRAATEENSRYLVEGVSSLLGDDISAGSLTPGDFYWLLYWILFASYPTFTRNVTITCNDPAHVAKVKAGELPGSSLRYLHQYARPAIQETQLDIAALEALDKGPLKRAGIELGYFSMQDTLDWAETRADATSPEDTLDWAETRADATSPEDYFIYELAVYIKGGTLDERAEIVRDMSVVQLDVLKKYRAILRGHGVIGTIKSTCKECGAEAENIISVSASDFL